MRDRSSFLCEVIDQMLNTNATCNVSRVFSMFFLPPEFGI